MKLNELLKDFNIQRSNEEQALLDKIKSPCYIEIFTEREKFIIENLVRKSLLSKVYHKGSMVVLPNEKS